MVNTMKKHIHTVILATLTILIATTIGIFEPKRASAAQRCFVETNQCMDGRIAEFWEQNGGLAVFGFPIGPQEQITVDGKTITVQRFERNRLELHPGNKRPYDVLLGRLGADRLGQQGRDWFSFAKSGDTGGCRVFAETGHAVCGSILKAWRANGLQIDGKKAVSDAESLALFGMPLSGLMTETLSDGKQYQVQWFERARFELHPENAAPYDVLLGLLGIEVGVPPGTRPFVVVQPTPVRVGPGAGYTPLPNKKYETDYLVRAGYNITENTVKWTVSSEYAAGLDDGTAEIYTNTEGNTGVQMLFHAIKMRSKNGNLWGIAYSLIEFKSSTAARAAYNTYGFGFEGGTFTGEYELANGCIGRTMQELRPGYMVRIDYLYTCNNSVVNFSIFGFGSFEEFSDHISRPKFWFLGNYLQQS